MHRIKTKLTEKTRYSLASCCCNNQCHYMNEKSFKHLCPALLYSYTWNIQQTSCPNALAWLYSWRTLNKPAVQLCWLALVGRLSCIGHTTHSNVSPQTVKINLLPTDGSSYQPNNHDDISFCLLFAIFISINLWIICHKFV